MKEHEQEEKDDFWSAHHYLFTAKLPTYYTQPQKVWGRFHTSEEQHEASRDEIIPIKEKKGKRTCVMMQPYVREPNLTLTIGLYNKPKQYADQESAIGETVGRPKVRVFEKYKLVMHRPGFTMKTKRLFCGNVFLTAGFESTPRQRI